jgi:hypothetical protein
MKEIFKDCFLNNNECKGKIIKAHILSQKATMKLLKSPTKAGMEVLHIGAKFEENKYIPKSIGWSKASAHHCFCKMHDDKLFKKIENGNLFNPEDIEQSFLHTLRSFSYAYYRKKEELNLFNTIGDLAKTIDKMRGFLSSNSKEQSLSERVKESQKMLLWEYEYVRTELLDILNTKDYEKMSFRSAIIDESFPFASAGVLMAKIICPHPKEPILVNYDSTSPTLKSPAIIMTVIPLKTNETAIIFGILSTDENAKIVLDKIYSLNKEDWFKAISSLMLTANKENTFFNLTLWDYMKSKGYDKQIIKEINKPRNLDLLLGSTHLSEINLFDDEFTSRNLNIS